MSDKHHICVVGFFREAIYGCTCGATHMDHTEAVSHALAVQPMLYFPVPTQEDLDQGIARVVMIPEIDEVKLN